MIVATKYYYYCFIIAHSSAQCIVKQSWNCDIKARNKCCTLEVKFYYFLKPNRSIRKKHHKDSAILVAPIVALSACRFYMEFL